MPLTILKYPHPTLKEVAKEVAKEDIDSDMRAIFKEMRNLMDEASGGGLAAIQVGIKKRFFIMIGNVDDPSMETIVAINPVIIEESSNRITAEEGCLSFPNVFANVFFLP